MGGRKAKRVPFEQRRGVPEEDAFYDTWQVCLVREVVGEAGATYVAGYDGTSTFLYFESGGYEDAGDQGSKSDTRFESGRHQ